MALEAVAVAGLTRLGSVSRWRVDWAHLWTWLQQAPTEDAVVGVVRWLALALAWWLLASSVLYSLARASRIPGLIRGTRWLTLPVVRSVVDRALVAAEMQKKIGEVRQEVVDRAAGHAYRFTVEIAVAKRTAQKIER